MLELLIFTADFVVLSKGHFQSLVGNRDTAKAEVQAEVTVVLDQIDDSEEDSVESIINNLFSEQARSSNGHRIAINHAVALLINGVLTLGRQDFFLTSVVDKVCGKELISNEARAHVVDMLAVEALIFNVKSVSCGHAHALCGDARELGGDIECERPETLDVD